MKKPKKKQNDFSSMPRRDDGWKDRAERENKLLESVGWRKVKIEDMEREAKQRELERQADEILLKAIAENVQTLCEGFASLKMPSNDPEYLKRLQTNEAARNAIANRLTQIDLVPDGVKTYIGVGSFTHGDARELALLLANHFEARIRSHD